MKNLKIYKQCLLIILCSFLFSCEDFLEIDVPAQKIISETVFNNDETALSAMAGIYNQLAVNSFSSGGPESVTVLAGLSADVLSPIRLTNLPYAEIDQHEILPGNFRNLNLWSSAYNMIYMTNSVLEGLANSDNISEEVSHRVEGEARFVRAFTYFYLVNLYGDVPLILNTDYRENALKARDREEVVYQQIVTDLQKAMSLLEDDFPAGERTNVNRNTVTAFLARVHLYLGNWVKAENLSTEVINQTSVFEILEDLNLVFLANSREAIWQLSPKGRGVTLTNTNEGATFIIHPVLSALSHLKLTDDFVESFTAEDKRLNDWVKYHQRTGSYYPEKYKIRNSTEEVTEYSMVLRLAEQYLIRAEARAMEGNLSGAIQDLDKIRGRAGLQLISEINPEIHKEELLDLILEERKKELFTEWGSRWLDLKRTGIAGEVFGATGSWDEIDLLYPIPEVELMKNPNITQNNGY